jgi:uncharacterized protein (TIGR00369 family)
MADRPELEHPFWKEVDGEVPLPPASRHLGLRFVDAQRGSGQITVEFAAREEFLNPHGQIQGGFLSAMLDETMGAAVATLLEPDEFAVSLEFKVSFLQPVERGTVRGEGRVLRRGRAIAFVEGGLVDAAGVTVATGTMTARIRRAKARV